jgi:hypothetical protein
MPSGSYVINDSLVLTGSKSLKVVASAATFSILTTQSFGNLSAYTLVNSGSPTSGTVGLWVYCANDELTSITLRIGSGASDYSQIAGVKTYTDGTDVQDGWNYWCFRLKNATETGTPDWTAVDYLRIEIVSTRADAQMVLDYLTIGSGDIIGLNGLGQRVTTYTETTTTY